MQTTHAHLRPSRPATRSQIGILPQSHHTHMTTANLTPTGAESQGPPHGVAWAAGEMTGRCSNLLTSSYKHPHPPRKHKRNSRHLGFSWFQFVRRGFLYKAIWHSSIFPFFPEKQPGGKAGGVGRIRPSVWAQSECLCPSPAPGTLATWELGLHSAQQKEQWSTFRRPFGEDALGFYLEEGPGLKAPPSPLWGLPWHRAEW